MTKRSYELLTANRKYKNTIFRWIFSILENPTQDPALEQAITECIREGEAIIIALMIYRPSRRYQELEK